MPPSASPCARQGRAGHALALATWPPGQGRLTPAPQPRGRGRRHAWPTCARSPGYSARPASSAAAKSSNRRPVVVSGKGYPPRHHECRELRPFGDERALTFFRATSAQRKTTAHKEKLRTGRRAVKMAACFMGGVFLWAADLGDHLDAKKQSTLFEELPWVHKFENDDRLPNTLRFHDHCRSGLKYSRQPYCLHDKYQTLLDQSQPH